MSLHRVTLWMSAAESRSFLVPGDYAPPDGDFCVHDLQGRMRKVDPNALSPFEVNQEQATAWAKEELGESLDELKHVIDDKLADWQQKLDEFKHTPVKAGDKVTPEAATAFFDFLKELPQVFRDSVSGDEDRVDSARKTAANLQERFNDAGLTTDDRLKNFPDRLAKISKQSESKNSPQKTKPD